MRLRAKFYVSSLTINPGTQGVKVNLQAVSRGDRNASWASATPCGTMEMTINNPSAAQQVEDFMMAARRTGKQPEVFIDITPSEDGWASDGHLFVEADVPDGHYARGNCGACGMPKDGAFQDRDGRNQPTGEPRPYHPKG